MATFFVNISLLSLIVIKGCKIVILEDLQCTYKMVMKQIKMKSFAYMLIKEIIIFEF